MGIFSFLIGIVMLVMVLKLLLLPFKVIIKFVINSVLGGIILLVCSFLGIAIQIYWWTVLLVGLLGVPGFFISLLITILI